MTESNDRLRELVAQVAASYFSNSHVAPAEIPAILDQIADRLGAVGLSSDQLNGSGEEEPTPTPLSQAQIRRSVTHDALISFEDNRPYKTLTRHLATRGLSPDEYRAKWGLPDDYPMISAAYSAKRSELAHRIGLGQMRRHANGVATPKRGGRVRRKTA